MARQYSLAMKLRVLNAIVWLLSARLRMLFPNPTVFDVGVFGLFDLLNEFGEAAVGSFANE